MNKNITALILIVLAIGIYFTFTQGQIDEAKAVSAVNDQFQTAIKTSNDLIKIRDQVQADYNKITPENFDRLEKMLPSSVDNIHLIVDINRLANESGVSLRNIKAEAAAMPKLAAPSVPPATGGSAGGNLSAPNTLASGGTLSIVKVTFDTTTSYQKFQDFMASIESNLRIMDVRRMSIQAADTGLYNFGVEINAYWLMQ